MTSNIRFPVGESRKKYGNFYADLERRLAELNLEVLGNFIGRELLTENRTYYVRSDGSDENTGLENTAEGAFATLQHASDLISQTIDLAGFKITVQVGIPGTYVGANIPSFVGGGIVYFLGDPNPVNTDTYIITSAPSIYGGQACFHHTLPSVTAVGCNGFRLFPLSSVTCIHAQRNCGWFLGDVEVGGGHMVYVVNNNTILDGSFVDFCATATIDATGEVGSSACFYVFYVQGGDAAVSVAAYTILGTLTVGGDGSFCSVTTGQFTKTGSITGTVVGQRYSVSLNGVINVGGAGANFFPGSVAGVAATGGQYA